MEIIRLRLSKNAYERVRENCTEEFREILEVEQPIVRMAMVAWIMPCKETRCLLRNNITESQKAVLKILK